MARLALIVSISTTFAVALPPLPAYYAMPPQMTIADPERSIDEKYGEAVMPLANDDNIKRGRRVYVVLQFPGVESDDNGAWRPKIWIPIRQALVAGGWVVRDYQDTNPPFATLQYQRNGIEAWTRLAMYSPAEIIVELIEVKPFTPTLSFPAPAAKPESAPPNRPFPFLPPLPGATMVDVDPDERPISVKFKDEEQPTMVTTGSVKQNFQGIDGVSTLQFILEYTPSLTKNGWQIVEQSQGISQSDATLTAHYAKGGRDIWAYLHFRGGEMSISVGEAGDLAAALKKECHVPMYGITFDFNKTTLRPDAEGSLQRIVMLLQNDAALGIEVQGHTDNVGGDDYNLTLSQGRADAVKTWLVAHTIPAGRVTTKGYGRTQPVADNNSDEGRARNRRVEIARAGCKA